jgi:hypothetical protein
MLDFGTKFINHFFKEKLNKIDYLLKPELTKQIILSGGISQFHSITQNLKFSIIINQNSQYLSWRGASIYS